jgi:hypothetical protein
LTKQEKKKPKQKKKKKKHMEKATVYSLHVLALNSLHVFAV